MIERLRIIRAVARSLELGWRDVPSFIVILIQRVTRTEWSENWHAWPHCCTQGNCWMHYSVKKAWCECACRWCRVARQMRRISTRKSGEVSK